MPKARNVTPYIYITVKEFAQNNICLTPKVLRTKSLWVTLPAGRTFIEIEAAIKCATFDGWMACSNKGGEL